MKLYDTIAAVSTPRGKGGVALIRISGADALSIAERVFFPHNGQPLSGIPVGKMAYGEIRMPSALGTEGASVDDGMGVYFRGPRSFTGEDTVEITCHGGILVTESVLSAVFAAGARPAEAGEFTRRAFVNGKLALSEAEALGTLLEAKTDAQLRLSRGGMAGKLSGAIDALSADLRFVLASAYAKIDYPDEDLADLSAEEMRERLSAIRASAEKLSMTYRTGRAAMEGIDTVICGPANAGKSSLYNLLVGRDAAIVTDIAGTTRDMLSETVALGRVTLRLTDTAGLRETADRVEQIGIDRARAAVTNAELILAVADASLPPDEEISQLLSELQPRKEQVIVLLNKSDRGTTDAWNATVAPFPHTLTVSLKDAPDAASEALRSLVEQLFTDGAIDLSRDAVVVNARQYGALLRAIEALTRAVDAIDMGLDADLYCLDAEAALAAFGELDGKEVGEAIVAEIFSKFCVGK